MQRIKAKMRWIEAKMRWIEAKMRRIEGKMKWNGSNMRLTIAEDELPIILSKLAGYLLSVV